MLSEEGVKPIARLPAPFILIRFGSNSAPVRIPDAFPIIYSTARKDAFACTKVRVIDMRIDKFLSDMGIATRKEAAVLAKKGCITVDGICISRANEHIDPVCQRICVNGVGIDYTPFFYLMLHKPEGYVSSTDDPGAPTVLELLPERYRRVGLFPAGRLDRNTTGFLLLTNNGPLAHRLLAPASHVAKEYAFRVKFPLSAEDADELRRGVEIEGGYTTLPCSLTVSESDPKSGVITLHEGKYHQIKLMMKAVHNQILSLSRISFAGIPLDPVLKPGEFRPLTPQEEEHLTHSVP